MSNFSPIDTPDKFVKYQQRTHQEFGTAQGNNPYQMNRMTVPQELRASQQMPPVQNVSGFDTQGRMIPMSGRNMSDGYQPYDSNYNSPFANNYMVANPMNQDTSVNRMQTQAPQVYMQQQQPPPTPFQPPQMQQHPQNMPMSQHQGMQMPMSHNMHVSQQMQQYPQMQHQPMPQHHQQQMQHPQMQHQPMPQHHQQQMQHPQMQHQPMPQMMQPQGYVPNQQTRFGQPMNTSPTHPSQSPYGYSPDNFMAPPQQNGIYTGVGEYSGLGSDQAGINNPFVNFQNSQLNNLRDIKNGNMSNNRW